MTAAGVVSMIRPLVINRCMMRQLVINRVKVKLRAAQTIKNIKSSFSSSYWRDRGESPVALGVLLVHCVSFE